MKWAVRFSSKQVTSGGNEKVFILFPPYYYSDGEKSVSFLI